MLPGEGLARALGTEAYRWDRASCCSGKGHGQPASSEGWETRAWCSAQLGGSRAQGPLATGCQDWPISQAACMQVGGGGSRMSGWPARPSPALGQPGGLLGEKPTSTQEVGAATDWTSESCRECGGGGPWWQKLKPPESGQEDPETHREPQCHGPGHNPGRQAPSPPPRPRQEAAGSLAGLGQPGLADVRRWGN